MYIKDGCHAKESLKTNSADSVFEKCLRLKVLTLAGLNFLDATFSTLFNRCNRLKWSVQR